jgi:hypothetical protein
VVKTYRWKQDPRTDYTMTVVPDDDCNPEDPFERVRIDCGEYHWYVTVRRDELIQIPPPIPAEPPPGAYLIGDQLAVHFKSGGPAHPTIWRIRSGRNVFTWDEVWSELGPDVKVTPLVPRDLPEVELPWRQSDANGNGITVTLHRLRDTPRIQLGVGGRTYWLFDVQASLLAAALTLAAAGPDTEREA